MLRINDHDRFYLTEDWKQQPKEYFNFLSSRRRRYYAHVLPTFSTSVALQGIFCIT